jgi:hypothetical protein
MKTFIVTSKNIKISKFIKIAVTAKTKCESCDRPEIMIHSNSDRL